LPNNIIILNAFIAENQLGSSLHDRLGCAKISLEGLRKTTPLQKDSPSLFQQEIRLQQQAKLILGNKS